MADSMHDLATDYVAFYGRPHGETPQAMEGDGNQGTGQAANPYVGVPDSGLMLDEGSLGVTVSGVLSLKKAPQPQATSVPVLRTLE